MGKRKLTSLLTACGVSALFMLGFSSCDGTTNEPEDMPSNFTASDFLENADNLTWEARVVGTGTRFDTNGQEISIESIDDTRKVTIGAQTSINGFGLRPMFAFDSDGKLADDEPIVYMGTNAGSIYAISRKRDYEFTILPKEVKTGKTWIVSDTLPPRHHSTSTITEYFKEYTNNAGKKYSDVIKTVTTFKDSSNFETTSGSIVEGTLEVYYAKGIGPIEYHLPSADSKSMRSNGKFRREHFTGKMSRKN